LLGVRDAARRMRHRAAGEREPAILEAVSFRFRGHSVIDPDRYRDPEEIKQGRAADPIAAFAAILGEAGIADDAWLKETAAGVEREVQEAIAFAEAGPDPQLEDLFTYMYATAVPNTPGGEDARALAPEA
jgi:pyruvate dehydrogenase E1 component alpha subunit